MHEIFTDVDATQRKICATFREVCLFDRNRATLSINHQPSLIEEVLTPGALAVLPAEWLATLKQGAEEVDVELLSAVIEQIRGHDPTLADALARLVEDFEYEEILTLIKVSETPEERW